MPETVHSFSVDLADAADFPTAPEVGTAFEVGINGQGFMLYDNREGEEFRYERTSTVLDPPRLATSETPFSEAIERYAFAGFAEWNAGRGQLHRDRPSALGGAFYDSFGVDPFTPGELKLLHATEEEVADTYAGLRLVVAGARLFVQTDADELWWSDTPGTSGTTFTVDDASSILDLTTDGSNWYAAAGAEGIFRGTTSDPGAAWSAIAARKVGWAGGRLCAAYPSSGSTPNIFTTLNDAGAEEVTGGRLTLPVGWSITGFTGGQGKVWFSAYSGDVGAIWVWDLTTAAPYVAWELPKGEIPTALLFYQGQVLVRSQVVYDAVAGNQAGIYRCVVQEVDGVLTPFLLDYIEVAGVDMGPGAFAAYGHVAMFSWRAMETGSGVGAIDLSTGGYAKWFYTEDAATGEVASIDVWQGRAVMAVRGSGVWLEDPDVFVPEGYVQSSVVDGASGLDKVYDEISIQCRPLLADQSIAFAFTLDSWESEVDLSDDTLAAPGAKSHTVVLGRRAKSMGVKLTLTGDEETTPVLLLAQLKFHALGATDTIVTLPIDCGDQLELLNGAEHPQNGPGAGMARVRYLLGLEGTRVKFQDLDWDRGTAAEVFEMVQVRVFKTSLYDNNQGRNAVRAVAVCTLRKAD